MKRLIALCAGVFLLPTAVSAQTLTSGPTTVNTVVTPASDYASLKQGNAWDMDRRTDLGWHTYGTDAPLNNLSSYAFTGCTAGTVTGCSTFQFTPANSQPTLFFLDSWQPGAAPAGPIGRVKPIDTTRFKYLMVRMKFTNGVTFTQTATKGAPQAVIYWSRDTIYHDASLRPTGGILRSVTNGVTPGIQLDFDGLVGSEWRVYVFRMDQLGWWNQSKNASLTLEGAGGRWGDAGVTADSLFFQPINYDGTTTGAIDIDWVRLTDVPTLQTISWTGGATQYDIVVSPNSNCSSYTVLAENQASGFQFPFASLEPGSYFVGLRTPIEDNNNTQNAVAVCSAGSYLVPGAATLALTSPTDEGSTDDYATTFLGNAWDFDAVTDPDEIFDIGGAAITTIAAQRPDGRSLGNVRVLRGTSPLGSDSFMYFKWFNERGLDNRIDPNRYRIFTVDFGVNRSRNINEGSIGRVIWRVNGDATRNAAGAVTRNLENVSEDLVFRHLNATTENGGVFILDRLQFDMKDRFKLPLETDTLPGFPDERSPARTGWTSACIAPACTVTPTNPGVDGFRFDFHEFHPVTDMYVSMAKLAALEQTGASYQIAWTATVPSEGVSNPVIKLFANAVVSTATGMSTNPGFNLAPADPTCTAGTSGLTQINPAAGTALSTGTAAGTFTWTPTGFTNGTEYYICGVIEGTINSTTVRLGETLTQFPIIVNTAYAAKPRLHFDKIALRFSGVRTAPSDPVILSSKTPDQFVGITQVGSGTGTWRVGSMLDSAGGAVNYLTVSPSSGSGTGRFTVSLTPHASLPACTAQDGLAVIIKFVSDGTTDNEPQYIRVFVTIRPQVATAGCVAPGVVPFGAFDTPAANATGVVGAIPVTGWALDDVGVDRVEIWRNCLTPLDSNRSGVCRNATPGGLADKVFIGNANFVPGARADIESANPSLPQAYRAGWGYLLLTNALPNRTSGNTEGGQGTFTLFAYAVDSEGAYTELGSRTITLDNDNSTVPFGAIDTPEQGGTVTSNVSANFGWAMTRRQNALGVDIPKCIERSRYKVYIDGVSRPLTFGGNFHRDLERPDLTAAYPGLCDSANSLAAYFLDVSALGLANGTHTIGWDVYDNNGTTNTQADDNMSGIGSRFFNILISSGDAPVAREASRLGQYELLKDWPRAAREVSVRVGPEEAALAPVPVTETGARLVRFPAGGRVMLDVGGAVDEGYQLVGDDLRALPIGSTLDRENGRFYWEPPVGFLGDFDLIFVDTSTRLDVRVTVVDPMGPREVLMHIDTPLANSTVGMGVNIAGWALDPQASAGSGIDALHIWSQRLDDPSAKAVFLGVAVPGGARPDVAAVHGAQFGPAGFLSPTVYLMPGLYDITVHAYSRRTGRFETARTVRVTVR
jgi:hypothetical protein